MRNLFGRTRPAGRRVSAAGELTRGRGRRRDPSRRYRGHRDAESGDFHRERPSQSYHPGLVFVPLSSIVHERYSVYHEIHQRNS